MTLPGVPGSQVPAGIDQIARRIQDLERQVRELAPSIAASFAPVITDLQNKQAQLDDLINSEVYPVRAQGDEGYPTGFSLTALDVAHGIATITVPSGYTRCAVVAVSTARGIGNIDWNIGMKTRIDGLDGNRTTFGTNTSTNSGGTISGSCANTETLTGLSGGTFDVSTVMSVNSGTPAVSVTTVVMATFLR